MRPWVEELRQLGWRRAAFRAQYELRLRSGLEAALRPAGARDREAAADAALAAGLRRAMPPLLAHLGQRAQDEAVRSAAGADRAAIERRMDDYARGRVRMFSRWEAEFGAPLDWHLNPRLGRQWPATDHWTAALGARGIGDIKLTWEPGRLAIAYDWGRAAALGPGDAARAQARDQFGTTLSGFETANPFRAGVQWASGQELAIRLLAWWFAFGALGGPGGFTDETVERLVRQTRLHARHLAQQIGYARFAVYNNHLIGEAVGLVLAADLLGGVPGAAAWRALGLRLLEGEALTQFERDGGYCQSSHTYHRLALHYYVWHVLLADVAGRPVAPALLDVLRRSRDYLLAQQNAADGWLPNWGANDGALCNPLAACDYADFRPVVRTLSAILGEPSPYPAGPWDAEAAWLVARPYPDAHGTTADGTAAVSAAGARPLPRAFPASGLYVTGGGGSARAILRAGTVHTRFGQADQNHLDVWWDGVNVVLDPGTFSYHERPDIHRAFSGTAAHSTVTVNGLDQMVPYRTFKWLRWSRTTIGELAAGADGLVRRIAATHDGYTRPGAPGVRHERQIDWPAPDRLRVTDRLVPDAVGGAPFRVRLHWLLADCVSLPALPSAGTVELAPADQAPFAVTLAPPGARPLAITVETEGLEAVSGALARAVPDAPWGWHARYYGVLEPAVALTVEGMSRGARFVTTFAAA